MFVPVIRISYICISDRLFCWSQFPSLSPFSASRFLTLTASTTFLRKFTSLRAHLLSWFTWWTLANHNNRNSILYRSPLRLHHQPHYCFRAIICLFRKSCWSFLEFRLFSIDSVGWSNKKCKTLWVNCAVVHTHTRTHNFAGPESASLLF